MIWVLAGTRDASEIIKRLKNEGFEILASAVTERGRRLAKDAGATETIGALDKEGMINIIRARGIKAVVDATHPFAVDASVNSMRACKELSAPYLRFERQRVETMGEGIHLADNFNEAGAKASELGKVIFYAAGSRNLDVFIDECRGKRVIARVLKDGGNVERCVRLGLKREDIIAATPPFTREENLAMFQEYKADVLVTKESGAVGGLTEKLEAARELDMEIVVVKRPVLDYPIVLEDYGEVVNWAKGNVHQQADLKASL